MSVEVYQIGEDMKKVTAIMEELYKLEVKSGQLEWVQFTAGYDFGIDECNEAIMAYLKNKDHFEVIKKVMGSDLSQDDRRRVELAYKTFEFYHKSEEINKLQLKIENKTNELSKVLNTFRFKLDGREVTSVELSQILMSNDDRELRKKAYLSRNQINQPMVDAGLLDLVDMRKDLAKMNGFDTFVDYMLYKDDLEADIFSGWKEQIQELLPTLEESRKEFGLKYLNDEIIMPWDEAYISGKIAPSLNKKVDMMDYYEVIKVFFAKFGFDLDEYNITYDVFSRKNKSEWGYNFPIETAKDSRILANVKDRYYEYDVLMHETGHGVHSFLEDPNETLLNMGVSGIVTEGIANLFGSLIYDQAFFKEFFNDNLEQATEEFELYRKWKNLNAIRQVGLIMFDQNFYRSDCKDLGDVYEMYWSTFGELYNSEPGDFEPPWAFKIHHTTHPIYLHNYFMGDVTCEMLHSVFKEKHCVNSITEKAEEFGKFLYEQVIKPSGRYTYSELFKRISGNDFSLNYMVK